MYVHAMLGPARDTPDGAGKAGYGPKGRNGACFWMLLILRGWALLCCGQPLSSSPRGTSWESVGYSEGLLLCIDWNAAGVLGSLGAGCALTGRCWAGSSSSECVDAGFEEGRRNHRIPGVVSFVSA